jgi:LPPG:FO 2-phospho-L-lactate transferase
LRIVVLAGGVGAARFLNGLAKIVAPEDLSCVVNTGDDIVLHGLHISPDLDIITYTLAGIVDNEKGWGISQDTYNCHQAFKNLGFDEWFRLGDKDLATHLYRSELLRSGRLLSEVTAGLCERLGVRSRVFPMTNDHFETWVKTDAGWIHFEEYYVRRGCRDEVRDVQFRGADSARPSPGVLEALTEADQVIVAPSNPIVSVGTILEVQGIRETLQRRRKPVTAISPIVAGSPLKGPADKFMLHRGVEVSPRGVAKLYGDFLSHLIIDYADKELTDDIASMGIEAVATNTVMRTMEDRVRLAETALATARHERFPTQH